MLEEKLIPLVYDQLRELAGKYLRHERGGHTLQGTALVHEAFLKMLQSSQVDWKGKTHFYHVAARAMRQVLVDYARRKKAIKHGGGHKTEFLTEIADTGEDTTFNMLALNELLEELTQLDPCQGRIVELKVWGGLSDDEVSQTLGVSKRKIQYEWIHAKNWLMNKLRPSA